MPEKFRILSVDGGGLKGLVAIKILQVIEDITGAATAEQFDLLAGTSTGGLIASALATAQGSSNAAHNLEHIEGLYLEVGQQLFRQGGLAYNGEEVNRFEKLLKSTFGSKRISEAKKPVFIPTYDTGRKKLVVFKTRSARADMSKDVTVVQACRATTAIEPVFQPYTMPYNGREITCVDAGYRLKNPALSALAEVWKHKEYYGVQREEDMVLLSVSTGTHRNGGSDWTRNIADVQNSQRMDKDYIRAQKLKIDLNAVKFMRVDLNLGGSSFSMMQLLNWLARIDELSRDKGFRKEVYDLLVPQRMSF